MVCVYCGGETAVFNSRRQKRSNQVWRRRRCLVCQATFTTHEAVDYRLTLSVNKNGALEAFNTERLFSDVLSVLKDRKNAFTDAREITDAIIQQLLVMPGSPIFTPLEITRVTSKVLRRFSKRAWHRYAADYPVLL